MAASWIFVSLSTVSSWGNLSIGVLDCDLYLYPGCEWLTDQRLAQPSAAPALDSRLQERPRAPSAPTSIVLQDGYGPRG